MYVCCGLYPPLCTFVVGFIHPGVHLLWALSTLVYICSELYPPLYTFVAVLFSCPCIHLLWVFCTFLYICCKFSLPLCAFCCEFSLFVHFFLVFSLCTFVEGFLFCQVHFTCLCDCRKSLPGERCGDIIHHWLGFLHHSSLCSPISAAGIAGLPRVDV